jgi:putative Mg2+ transporter-C (MgtC) family protein
MLDLQTIGELALPLIASIILGGLLGIEREIKGHWAGLRTHIMVSMGAALFILIGVRLDESRTVDLSRIIQGIATGIGFIGAGTIVKLTEKMEVRGLTTASSVWLAAAVGTACGVGAYALAAMGAVFSVIVLTTLRRVERHLEPAPEPESPDTATKGTRKRK